MDLLFWRSLASRIPGAAWISGFVLLLIAMAVAGLVHLGEVRGATKVTRAARKDSLQVMEQAAAQLRTVDSQATQAVHAAAAGVQHARIRRASAPSVAVASDSSVTVATSSGADSTVVVPSAVVTRIQNDAAQIAADSVALQADSAKIAVLEQRQPIDSAAVALRTRVDGDRAETEPGGGSGHVLLIMGAVSTTLLALVTLLRH